MKPEEFLERAKWIAEGKCEASYLGSTWASATSISIMHPTDAYREIKPPAYRPFVNAMEVPMECRARDKRFLNACALIISANADSVVLFIPATIADLSIGDLRQFSYKTALNALELYRDGKWQPFGVLNKVKEEVK